MLNNLVIKLGLKHKPQNIFNCDETNFSSASSNSRVFCEKGVSVVNKICANNEELNYFVQVNNSITYLKQKKYIMTI